MLYKIKIEIEDTVEAENEEDAYTKFWERQIDGNTDLPSLVDDNTTIDELCPHCESILKPKMIDIDGTNLVERNICEKCGYGMPALI